MIANQGSGWFFIRKTKQKWNSQPPSKDTQYLTKSVKTSTNVEVEITLVKDRIWSVKTILVVTSAYATQELVWLLLLLYYSKLLEPKIKVTNFSIRNAFKVALVSGIGMVTQLKQNTALIQLKILVVVVQALLLKRCSTGVLIPIPCGMVITMVRGSDKFPKMSL